MVFNMLRIIGVTFIELIIVLAIIAILAVVGYPSYHTYLVESRRADAINALRENQFVIENYIQQNGDTPTSVEVTLATNSPEGFYTIAYTQVDSDSYKLVATAATNTSQESDTDCLTITLISEMDTIYPTYCH